jgi:hypothetical protein
MADNGSVTSNDDSLKPQNPPTESAPEPAARKPFNSTYVFQVAGVLIGAYFLISGAWGIRESQGNVVAGLIVAATVALTLTLGWLMFKSFRAERAAKK